MNSARSWTPEGRGTARSPEQVTLALGLGVIALIIAAVALAMDRINFDVVIGVLTLLSLMLISVPILRRVAVSMGDVTLSKLFMWAMVFKFAFAMVRYFFITVIYSDNGDAGVYSSTGSILMELYRHGIFTLTAPGLAERGAETARVAAVVGVIYVVTGVSRYAASFIFSWLCFMGQIWMVKAFYNGVPEGDHRRYATLVLFLPSMLFWPSSIGKEALMIFSIGLVSLGASQVLGAKVRVTGILVFLAGAGGLFYIRPHMALISIVSLGFASAVSTIVGFSGVEDKKASSKAFAVRMIALVVLIGASSVATTQLSNVLGDGTGGAEGVSGVLARTTAQTAEGGSQFTPAAVTTPLGIPAAVVTVLFRPFPWESHNINGLIASSEGVLFMCLVVAGRRRLISWCKVVGRRPYLVFAAAFAMTFIIAFSYIGNFGILARQRTQTVPLALTLLGMPIAARTRTSWWTGRNERRTADTEVDPLGPPPGAVPFDPASSGVGMIGELPPG